MISLDFANIEPWSYEFLGDSKRNHPYQIYFHVFFGNQIFVVNGVEFTGDYPVLGFARELKKIALELSYGKDFNDYYDPENEQQCFLRFSRMDNNVEITLRNTRDHQVLAKATVPIEELVSSSIIYLDRAFNHFAEICPELKDNEFVKEYMTDLSRTGQDWSIDQ